MTSTMDLSPAGSAADLLLLLRNLARTGGQQDRGLLDPEALEAALAAGFVAEAPVPGTLRLTRKGRMELRRLRCTAGAAAARALPPPPPARSEQRVNEGESPLAWLRQRLDRDGRPMIGEAQYQAGERLRADLWRAHLTPRVTQSWSGLARSRSERRGSWRGPELGDRALAARQRVLEAVAAVGPELAGILIDVCGHLKGLEEVERSSGWPQRSAKIVLQAALTGLARHYGLLAPEPPETMVARRLRHWGTDGYRPGAAPPPA